MSFAFKANKMKVLGPDFRHLRSLTELNQKDRQAALKAVCHEFEALFLYQLLQEMRRSVPESGFWPKSLARDFYEDLYYQEVSRQIAQKGTGLGEMLYRQLVKHYGGKK